MDYTGFSRTCKKICNFENQNAQNLRLQKLKCTKSETSKIKVYEIWNFENQVVQNEQNLRLQKSKCTKFETSKIKVYRIWDLQNQGVQNTTTEIVCRQLDVSEIEIVLPSLIIGFYTTSISDANRLVASEIDVGCSEI